jgi:hypothetical protein
MQPRDILIRELNQYGIPWVLSGGDIAIICPFKSECGGTSGDFSTFLINASTRSGNCRSCGKTAPFSEVLEQFGIGLIPEGLPSQRIHRSNHSSSRSETSSKRNFPMTNG